MATDLLIQNLQKAELFDHPVERFKLIETHISWVILTGEYCYKIKKPMNFGFLDFTTLEQRHTYCDKELELNQKLAPEIYLEVLPISGSEENPRLGEKDSVIEYAIKMREFSQNCLFDALLRQNQLHSAQMIDLAHELANFHESTSSDSPEYFGTPQQIFDPVEENFMQIGEMIKEPEDIQLMETVKNWSYETHKNLTPVFQKRRNTGFVKACHGDVHLGNITLYKDKPVIFDCIEFNESFRYTDTMADLGFLLMDLEEKNQSKFASIVLNTYMIHTGDYEGVKVLPFYCVYRAVVRAKIALFEYHQQTDPKEAQLRLDIYRKFMKLAQKFAKRKSPMLLLTHGFSGSGKSTLAKLLVENANFLQLRSDVERKRMQGIAVNASSHSGLYQDLYSETQTQKTYEYLLTLTKISLHTGFDTIVDATFQKQSQRKAFMEFAKKNNIPFCILHCEASMEKLLDWIQTRSDNTEISEANREVLLAQQDKFEPLTAEEISHCISINMENTLNPEIILRSINDNINQVGWADEGSPTGRGN